MVLHFTFHCKVYKVLLMYQDTAVKTCITTIFIHCSIHCQIEAKDKDAGENANISITMVSSSFNVFTCHESSPPFAVNASTGDIVMTESALHCSRYSFVAEACDNPNTNHPGR